MAREEAKDFDKFDFLDFQIDIIEDMIDKIYHEHELEIKAKDEELRICKNRYDAMRTKAKELEKQIKKVWYLHRENK